MRVHAGVPVVAACLLLAAVLPAAGQGDGGGSEPDRVTVQHLLVSFKGKMGADRYIDRTKQEAEELAQQLFERARGGEDFEALVKEYTNDNFPGIYSIANKKVDPKVGEIRRFDMVRSFGDVAFSLDVGEVGLAEYHATRSPYGWHIILRLE